MVKPKKQIPIVKDKEKCQEIQAEQSEFNKIIKQMANTKPIDDKDLKNQSKKIKN